VAALKKGKLVELFWKLHPRLYKLSGGLIGARLLGMPVLLLTTTGRKSGRPRERALTYVPDGPSCVVIASYLGEPRHPDWYLNLKARPEALVRAGRETFRVHAREAEGAERERLWKEAVRMNADYEEYRARTTRRIPIVVLERQA